jgi:TetR/AcrR family transcriptional regulator, cholesterol catabolism regulator
MKAIDDSARRSELRAAAARLFRKVGYSRATVRDIAKAVGLQSGSIFYHFKSKEEILEEVMSEGMRHFLEAAAAALRDEATPRMRLRALLIGHLKALHSRDSDELTVVLSEWRSLSPTSRRHIVKQRDEVDAAWDTVLRDLAAAGQVRGDLNIVRLAILGAVNWSVQWYDKRGKLSIEDLADQLLDLFVPDAARAR